MPIARLNDLRLQLGRTPVLTGVDLSLEEGERLGVAGLNGAGKTTLLAVLATLKSPTGGNGEVLGAALGTSDVRAIRPRIGLSGHQPALYDELTIGENLRHVARLAGVGEESVAGVLEEIGLGGAMERRTAESSNGMRRRVDLARLLVTRPQLVLLDEAQAGLDAEAGIIVDEISRRAVAERGAVVMVSHDAGLLTDRVDRVVRLVDGSLVG